MCDLFTPISSAAEVVAALAAVIALFALGHQIGRARISLNVELILKLDDRFNESEFVEMRVKAALALKAVQGTDNRTKDADEIFDFFETVGYLVRTDALDEELAWHTFYEWVHGYWSVGHKEIVNRRAIKKDRELWVDFEWLQRTFVRIQARKTDCSTPEVASAPENDEFLADEISNAKERSPE